MSKWLIIGLTIVISGAVALSHPVRTLATPPADETQSTDETVPLTTTSEGLAATVVGCARPSENLGGTITQLICVIRNYTTALAVIIVMVVGLMYILGGFKPDMAATAKTILTTTITGLIFMYLIGFIVNFLASTGILVNTPT